MACSTRPSAIMRLALLVLVLATAEAAADDTALIVGTAGDYRPLTWYDPTTDSFSGTDIDLMREFAKSQGLEVRFVKTTWPTLTADLLAGKFDAAIGGISRTDQRAKDALLSVTIETTGKVALVRCGDETQFGSFEAIDREGVTVVENRGGTNEKFALSHLQHATLIIVPDNAEPFGYLKDKRADVMFTDSVEALYQQQISDDALCAVKPGAPYTHIEKVVMFAKSAAKLRDQFDTWFKAHH
jgi:cyclohexadienyl dehydratase